jgi:hypothetical protein
VSLRLHLGLAVALVAALALPTGASAVTGPATHAFPVTTIGSPSTATLTFSAQTTPTEPVQSVSLTGPQSAAFQVTDDRCSGQAVAGTCDVTVAFAPASVGAAAATLRVVGDAGLQDVALTGTGSVTGAKLVVSPAAVDFGDVYPWTATTRTLTLSNTGDVPVSIDGIGVTGPQASAFAIEADGCGGQTIAPAGGCSLVVRFVRGYPGPRSAQLHLTLGGAPAIEVALSANLVNVFGLAPPSGAPMFGPTPWSAFGLTAVTGRHKKLVIELYTSLPANLRVTVLRKGVVVARNRRVVRLGATTLRWRGLRTGRYVVKAEGRRKAEVRRASKSVTVTR